MEKIINILLDVLPIAIIIIMMYQIDKLEKRVKRLENDLQRDK
jgi:hypothetical protein